jgi:hypothetical protein
VACQNVKNGGKRSGQIQTQKKKLNVNNKQTIRHTLRQACEVDHSSHHTRKKRTRKSQSLKKKGKNLQRLEMSLADHPKPFPGTPRKRGPVETIKVLNKKTSDQTNSVYQQHNPYVF